MLKESSDNSDGFLVSWVSMFHCFLSKYPLGNEANVEREPRTILHGCLSQCPAEEYIKCSRRAPDNSLIEFYLNLSQSLTISTKKAILSRS